MFARYIGALFALILFSEPVFAKGQKFLSFNLGLALAQTSREDSEGDNTVDKQVINFHGGFFPFGGLIVGLRHYQSTTTSSTTTILTGSTKQTESTTYVTSGSGIHVGYYAQSGFIIGGSYLFNPTYKSEGTEHFGGSATVLDAGWIWEVGDFGFGAQLTHSTFIFKKSKVNGVETEFTKDEKFIDILPMGFATLFF